MSEFKLDYTASEINQKLGDIDKKLETVDWEEITNRPFYMSQEPSDELIEIIPEDSYNITSGAASVYSENVITPGKEYVVNFQGNIYQLTCATTTVYDDELFPDGYSFFQLGAPYNEEDGYDFTEYPFLVTLIGENTSKNKYLYTILPQDDSLESVTVSVSEVQHSIGEMTMDSKYIPHLQSDWEADETSVNYIKNKPFGKLYGSSTLCIYENSNLGEGTYDDSCDITEYSIDNVGENIDESVAYKYSGSQKIKLKINDTIYDNLYAFVDESLGMLAYGSEFLELYTGKDTKYPFMYCLDANVLAVRGENTVTSLEIYSYECSTKKIDGSYVDNKVMHTPDTDAATVGQVITVKTVDDGVPTEYETKDIDLSDYYTKAEIDNKFSEYLNEVTALLKGEAE